MTDAAKALTPYERLYLRIFLNDMYHMHLEQHNKLKQINPNWGESSLGMANIAKDLHDIFKEDE